MGTQGAGSAVHCHLRRPRCSTIRTQELAEVLRRSPAGNTLDSRLHSPSLTTCMREQQVRPLHRVAGVLDRVRRRAACGGRRLQQRRARDERAHGRLAAQRSKTALLWFTRSSMVSSLMMFAGWMAGGVKMASLPRVSLPKTPSRTLGRHTTAQHLNCRLKEPQAVELIHGGRGGVPGGGAEVTSRRQRRWGETWAVISVSGWTAAPDEA